MIKIAICDDSPCDAAYLEKLCNKCDTLYAIIIFGVIKTNIPFYHTLVLRRLTETEKYSIIFLEECPKRYLI